jgi:DNA-binding MarR family transcriptional regulator
MPDWDGMMPVVARIGERIRRVFAWVKRRLKRSEIGDLEHGQAILREVARRRSCPVPDVASKLGLPREDSLDVLIELEKRGLVRLSEDRGVGHTRLVAITRKGRALARR